MHLDFAKGCSLKTYQFKYVLSPAWAEGICNRILTGSKGQRCDALRRLRPLAARVADECRFRRHSWWEQLRGLVMECRDSDGDVCHLANEVHNRFLDRFDRLDEIEAAEWQAAGCPETW